MSDDGRKFDPVLITALARGSSIAAAASEAGCSERTVYRRRQDATFMSEVRLHRATILEQTAGVLVMAATRAVATLFELLSSENESIRLSASRFILDGCLRWREQTELGERVAALEEKNNGQLE